MGEKLKGVTILAKFVYLCKFIIKRIIKFIRKLKTLIIRSIKNLKNKNIQFVYWGDLMTTKRGTIARDQLLVVACIICFEKCLMGDYSFEMWSNVWDEKYSKVRASDCWLQWKYLNESLCKHGLNPNLSSISVRSRGGQLVPVNGVHRMAWCYLNNWNCIPINVLKKNEFVDEFKWNDLHGFRECHGVKVSSHNYDVIMSKYKEICKNLDQRLFCYLYDDEKSSEVILEEIKKYGDLYAYEPDYPNEGAYEYGIDKKIERMIKKMRGRRIHLYNFVPYQQDLYYKKDIHSEYIQEMSNKIKNTLKNKKLNTEWGVCCESVTESILVRPYIEYYWNCKTVGNS